MIVTCPSCDAKYRADADALAARGGKVRCAGCGHVWTVEDEALTLEQPAEAAPAPEPEPEPDIPKKPHEVIRHRAEKRRKTARLATEGVGWAGIAALFLVVLGAAWIFRVDVVQTFPRAASVYASVGVPVNPHGLEVHNLAVEREGAGLAIEGEVVNVTGRERATGPLRAALLDADGEPLVVWNVLLESPALAPGALERFHTQLDDVPEGGAEVLVELAPGTAAASGEGA